MLMHGVRPGEILWDDAVQCCNLLVMAKRWPPAEKWVTDDGPGRGGAWQGLDGGDPTAAVFRANPGLRAFL